MTIMQKYDTIYNIRLRNIYIYITYFFSTVPRLEVYTNYKECGR